MALQHEPPGDVLGAAMQAHQSGDLARAARLYREMLSRDPDCADAWHLYGLLAHQQGQGDEAVRRVRRAIALNPAHAPFHYNLGEIHRTRGEALAARRAYSAALALDPGHVGSLDGLGLVLHELGHGEQAIRCFQDASAADPRCAAAFQHLGAALRGCGRLASAREALARACALAPGLIEARMLLGDTAAALGDTPAAARAYEQVLAREPGYAPALSRLGDLHEQGRRLAEAERCFREWVRVAPGDAQAHRRLGNVLLDSARPREAIDAYRTSMAIDPALAPTWNDLGVAHMVRGDAPEAIRCFHRAMALDPQYTATYENLARCRSFADAAEADIAPLSAVRSSAALALPARISIEFALGKICDDRGEYDEAFAHYTEANAFKRPTVDFDAERFEASVAGVIEVFSSTLFARLGGGGSSAGQPLFIVGMPRSGTTLVEQIIASHPQAHGAGELPFVSDLTRELAGRLGSHQPYPRCTSMLDQRTLAECAAAYLDRIGALGGRAARVTDKMPTNFFHLGFIALLFPKARIIHCRRGAMDVCLSNYFQHYAAGNDWSYDLGDIAVFYKAYERLMHHWAAVLPVPVHEVRYERLVDEPGAEIPALIAACDLPWHAACADFHVHHRAVHTASLADVRKPLYRHAMARWRHYDHHLWDLKAALEGAAGS